MPVDCTGIYNCFYDCSAIWNDQKMCVVHEVAVQDDTTPNIESSNEL